MEFTDTYRTIAREAQSTYREKASKFLAFSFPVSQADEIKSALEKLRQVYHDARHHCYAYRFGFPDYHYRMNDDGEPSGSAGKPIYGQILSMELSDVLVVVVRYFGGTRLGIPGLIHAYRVVTQEVLTKSGIRWKMISDTFDVTFGYPQTNTVLSILKKAGAALLSQEFDQVSRVAFSIRKTKSKEVEQRLTKLSDICIFKR